MLTSPISALEQISPVMRQIMVWALRKNQRLSRRTDFLAIHRGGKKYYRRGFKFLILIKPEGPRRLGITVSKRVGNSVCRNHVKRIVREVFRLKWQLFPEHADMVLSANPSLAEVSFNELRAELEKILTLLHSATNFTPYTNYSHPTVSGPQWGLTKNKANLRRF